MTENNEKYWIEYEEDNDENFPILRGNNLSICLFRGYYFVGGQERQYHGKFNQWRGIEDNKIDKKIRAKSPTDILAEIIPAFADRISVLEELIYEYTEVFEKWVNESLEYFSFNDFKFDVNEIDLDNYSSNIEYRDRCIDAFKNYEKYNSESVKYLVNESLESAIDCDIVASATHYFNSSNIGIRIMKTIEILKDIDKEFEYECKSVDSSWIKELIIDYTTNKVGIGRFIEVIVDKYKDVLTEDQLNKYIMWDDNETSKRNILTELKKDLEEYMNLNELSGFDIYRKIYLSL